MITERLYYSDSHLFEFDAVVKEICPSDRGFAVILDRTAFFPEGGGQPGDVGWIDDIKVIDTKIRDDSILHYVERVDPLVVGAQAHCRLDAEVRFARMQAHSGEHILSGLAYRLFGVNNVGFHMDGYLMTVDFNRYLSKEELSQLEYEANRIVWANKRVRTFFPSEEECGCLSYRSKADAYLDLRLVEIEDCDLCACCAPHVASTGEIGLIKIMLAVSHRGGIRLTLLCGAAAYEDYLAKFSACLSVSALLKVPHHEIAQGVSAMMERMDTLRSDYRTLENQLVASIVSTFQKREGYFIIFTEDLSSDALRRLAEEGKKFAGGIFIVFNGNDETGYRFFAASDDIELTEPVKRITCDLCGKGGGRNGMAQGSLNATREEIEKYFSLQSSDGYRFGKESRGSL